MLTSLTCSSVAKDRSWFTKYAPINSAAYKRDLVDVTDAKLRVRGIGTVKIQLRQNQGAVNAIHEIVLTNVLHIPEATYNIVCYKRLAADYEPQGWSMRETAFAYPHHDMIEAHSPGQPNTFTAFLRILQTPAPEPQAGGQPQPMLPRFRLVDEFYPPRGCTLGASRFQEMLNSNVAWFEYVTVRDDQRLPLEEAARNASSSSGARPRTRAR